ncbi:MAG TPA: glycoside hydrolase family 31 protein [Ginsengibacter sp.]|nr:glycoside hydrolase family 31 protein [Ginsengibacter sp.]
MKKHLLNQPLDMSEGFRDTDNEFFVAHDVLSFDPDSGKGKLKWLFHKYVSDWFFNKIDKHLELQTDRGAPFQDYELHPTADFAVSFLTARTIRLRMQTGKQPITERDSLMIPGKISQSNSWTTTREEEKVIYKSSFGSLEINTTHFSIRLKDQSGRILTETLSTPGLKAMHSKYPPFCFMRDTADYAKKIAATFSLLADEKIYGCGESFTSLNKRGQKLNLFAADAQSAASPQMYKPIPFFFSNRGYGIFVHTSAPLTFDFGNTHQGADTIYSGDDTLDLFLFIGNPAEILYEYTSLTGRAAMPPLWSFGLWMGCLTYTSQSEVMEVASKMREMKFPCDVIHIDAGWFENGTNCDFEFNKEKFPAPAEMMSTLKAQGFRTSLWQIPYFRPGNTLFAEIVSKGLHIKDAKGNPPTEDAILDFSNPETIEWYQNKLRTLYQLGASNIKVDFGEAAPLNGHYSSGADGLIEHNLYPLRYNKTVSDLAAETTGERIIWARSAWAGSQRYPIHWGGDAEVSDAGMAGSLRGGLSLGLSGFTFWSHDIGGFSESPVEALFARWAFWGLLSSHSRVHGFPPREPWHFSLQFQQQFRKISELRYQLIPYIYTQAKLSADAGLPLLKALLLNYPEDPTVWTIEDAYLLGNDLLIAPLMEFETSERKVYLPEGRWIDLQTKHILEGGQWHTIQSHYLPGIILVKYGTLLPIAERCQTTQFMNWHNITLVAFSDDAEEVKGNLYTPESDGISEIRANTFNTNTYTSSSESYSVIHYSKIDL